MPTNKIKVAGGSGGTASALSKKRNAKSSDLEQRRQALATKQAKEQYFASSRMHNVAPVPIVESQWNQALKSGELLQKLSFTQVHLQDAEWAALFESLAIYRRIQCLSLWQTPLSGESLCALVSFVVDSHSILAQLELNQNQLTCHPEENHLSPLVQFKSTMAQLLKLTQRMNPHMKRLSIDYNAIGVQGMKALCQGLASNRNAALQQLSLRYCSATPLLESQGSLLGMQLAEAIQSHSSLLSVDLTGNRLGNQGLAALMMGALLQPDSKLETLILVDNDLVDCENNENHNENHNENVLNESDEEFMPLEQNIGLLERMGPIPFFMYILETRLKKKLPETEIAKPPVTFLAKLDLRGNPIGRSAVHSISQTLTLLKRDPIQHGPSILIGEGCPRDIYKKIWEANKILNKRFVKWSKLQKKKNRKKNGK